MKHTAFFGDGEKSFALSDPMILELERKTGVGIGLLMQRVRSGSYALRDLVETIRCGLIGGGTDPKQAADLCWTYVENRPILESYTLALGILLARFVGTDDDQPGTPAPDTQDDLRQAAATGDASAILRARIAEAYAKDDAE
jgi:Phage tail tube protein, GTA-gp10